MSLFNFFKRLVSPSTPAPAPAEKPAAGAKAAKPLKRAAARPDHHQPIYDRIAARGAKRIIEFGAGRGDRAEKMLAATAGHATPAEVVYVGVDFFEAGATTPPPGATLRDVYKRLKATHAAVKLLPGDLASTLGHLALTTSNYDVIVVGESFATQNFDAGWAKLARLLQPEGVVFVEERMEGRDAPVVKAIEAAEVARLAETTSPARSVSVSAKPAAAPALGEGRGPRPHFPPTGTTRAAEPAAGATSTRKGAGREPRSTANVKT